MAFHESEKIVNLPLSTSLLRILFIASIIANSFATKNEANKRLPLMIQPLQWR